MKVLFLDIDGVLNSADWFRARQPRQLHGKIDPAAVRLLNEALERTGDVCVLSSSWRLWHGLGDTKDAMCANGFRGVLLDTTPDCARETAGGLFIGAERGAEIQEWLNAHPDVTAFAIVDDSKDMGPLARQLVRTTWQSGLEREHVERLVEMLGERV